MSRVIAVRSPSAGLVVSAQQRSPAVLAVREKAARRVVAGGLRGPKGQTGQVLPPIPFAYGDASPRLIHQLTETQLLVSLQVILTVPFNGEAPAILVRTQAGDALIDADQIEPGFPATYESTPGALLAAGTGIYLEITPGVGASAGSGFVVLNLN